MKHYVYLTKVSPVNLPGLYLVTLCSTAFQGLDKGVMCYAMSAWYLPVSKEWVVYFSISPSPPEHEAFDYYELYSSCEWPPSWHSAQEVR